MDQGKIVQLDTPEKIKKEPANEFVYQLVGRICCKKLEGLCGESLKKKETDSDILEWCDFELSFLIL